MKVSVVILTKNEEKNIGKCIKSIHGADEIIVVDGQSKDRTREIAKALGAKVIIEKGKCGFGHARNLGLKKAKNEYVAFISADAIASNNWLEKIIKPLTDPKVAATHGIQKLRKIQTLVDSFHYRKTKKVKEPAWWSTPNAACKKSIILKLGGFNKELPASEDALMGFKIKALGYKIAWCPDAVVYHEEHLTLKEWLKKRYRESVAEGIICRRVKFLRAPFIKSLIPFFFLFSLLLGYFFNQFLIILPVGYIIMVIRNMRNGNLFKVSLIKPFFSLSSLFYSSSGFWFGYLVKSKNFEVK